MLYLPSGRQYAGWAVDRQLLACRGGTSPCLTFSIAIPLLVCR
jgi:hypothetical protein